MPKVVISIPSICIVFGFVFFWSFLCLHVTQRTFLYPSPEVTDEMRAMWAVSPPVPILMTFGRHMVSLAMQKVTSVMSIGMSTPPPPYL